MARVVRSWLSTTSDNGMSSTSPTFDSDGRHLSPVSSASAGILKRGRLLFLASLLLIGVAMGSFTFKLTKDAQREYAIAQFDAIADNALAEAKGSAIRQLGGTAAMATVVGRMLPDADAYPLVTVPGFESIATSVLEATSGREFVFVPIVQQDEQEAFESFAYDYFKEKFPEGTAESSFGKGIWATDLSLTSEDKRYHHKGGRRRLEDSPTFLTPILQHDSGVSPVLMLNIRSLEERRRQIDEMLACTRADTTPNDTSSCAAITDIVTLAGRPVGSSAGAVVLYPVYPANDPTEMTAILASTVEWNETFKSLFKETVTGIDCILETAERQYTFTVDNGVIVPREFGDLHQTKYDKYRRSVTLNDPGVYTDESPLYTLSLYPNDKLFTHHAPFNPTLTTLAAVGIMLFTSFLFICYDTCVRREFLAKKGLMESRRKYVRFISHEVRTPLNSVCIGLSLFQEKIAQSLGFGRADTLSKCLLRKDVAEAREMESPDAKLIEALDKKSLEWFTLSQDILLNAQGSVDVLNDFLNYDKIESGDLRIEMGVVSIWSLVQSTANEFKLGAAKKRLKFTVSYPDVEQSGVDVEAGPTVLPDDLQHRKVLGDEVRLRQVLRNIISNAVKFTPDGGSVEICAVWRQDEQRHKNANKSGLARRDSVCRSIRAPPDHEIRLPCGYVDISVQDSGAGMSEPQLARLFTEGTQFNVNELQDGGGSGLGMFVSKGITKQHKGSLRAESAGLGRGTTFTLSLPLHHVLSAQSETLQRFSSFARPEQQVNTKSQKILVVDDSLSNRKLLRRLLEHHGHECEEAENGRKAVSAVIHASKRNSPFETILMDYDMPVMNGPTACEKIRNKGYDSFIVGVSGNMFPDDIDKFLSSGANFVLPKPFKMAALDEVWMESTHKTMEISDQPNYGSSEDEN